MNGVAESSGNVSHLDEIKVGLVGPLPPPSGGMANQTQQLASLLRRYDVSVRLVQTNAPYKPQFTRRIPVFRAFVRLAAYLPALRNLSKSVDVIHIMANSGWSWHLFSMPAIWIARYYNTPTIVNYRGGEAETFFTRSFRWVKPSLVAASKIIVPSKYLETVFSKWSVATEVIPNIVDLTRFHPGILEPKNSRTILVARNLEEIYDNESAIRAFNELGDTHLDVKMIIAGSGPEEKKLKALTSSMGLSDRIRFTGRVPTEDMPDLYRSADIFLNPSTVDNMPNSILESYASGVPVVSTNVGGVPTIAAHEHTALLVEPKDYRAMAKAILRVLEDTTLRERLTTNALDEVSQYDSPAVIRKWIDSYRNVASARPSK